MTEFKFLGELHSKKKFLQRFFAVVMVLYSTTVSSVVLWGG